LKVKKCTPSLFSQSVVGQFTPKWLASMHTANREKPLPHKLQFHVKFMCVSCQFSIYWVYFFNIWFGMVQNQKV